MAPQSWAARRLQKDLQEVLNNPLFNVVGEPLKDNLFEWHVNIRTPDQESEEENNAGLENANFHLILKFPTDFPNAGPEVFLCSPLPHPNVTLNHASSAQRLWRVSLWDCMPAYKGWSSAYSVQSVLLQLQTFLLQEDLLYDVRKVPIEAAAQRARAFTCKSCGHSGQSPSPAFLTPFDIEVKLRNRQKKYISRPQEAKKPVRESADHPVRESAENPVPESTEAGAGWKVVEKKKQPKGKSGTMGKTKQSKVTSGTMEKKAQSKPVESRRDVEDPINMGLFGLLPREPITTIMCLLEKKDMGAMSLTCRGLRAACEDGYIWKKLFQRHYPAASLTAASLEDWKHVFLLEQSNVVESLRCFHLKCTHEEDVLGFPVSFTINPKTRAVQHIEVHLDVLSQEAFNGGVRLTADNQPFKLFFPLYINEDHFEKALPTLKRTIMRLGRQTTFTKELVLDVLPKVLNTFVVLLSDKGIQSSERAIEGYCMLHRLFLALCERFSLWRHVHDAVTRFKTSRTKEECPDLGQFLSLLSVCSTAGTHWKDVVRPLTDETFDRNVLWNCKHDLSAKDRYIQAARGAAGSVNEELLRNVWEGSRVSLRLNMFHAGFLHLVARPDGVSQRSVIAQYDKLFGMPSAPVKKRLQEFISQVMRVFSPGYDCNLGWPYFFRTMGMQIPSKAHFTGWMGQCWKNSLEKGYHTRSTAFEKIHRSGVSKILLKGESYSAPPNMKSVQMVESWGYIHEHVQYLDASCLLYNLGGEFIGHVDYASQRWGQGAIRHSGDEIDHEQRRGTHKIEISLGELSGDVQELYFTMSGWVGARLSEFRLPYVELKDAKTATDLCSYTFEGRKSDAGAHTSVIMCRMFRAGDRWEVEALGSYSDGDASNYEPMKRSIQGLISARKADRRSR